MADDIGLMEHSSIFESRFYECNQQARMSHLMEQLRSKRQRQCSWADMAKHFKAPLTDKRMVLDTLDKTVLHKHIEMLQKAVKVSDKASLTDRLECVALQHELKFSLVNSEAHISHDSFYIQISLDSNEIVKDTVVCFNSEPATCPELTKSLSECNLEVLTAQINGLLALSSICHDKKQKSKFLTALQSLETDLNQLSKFQSIISSVPNYIHKSPLGILLPRNGGIAMRMIYFVGPYDLLNETTKSSSPMTVEAIIENKIGYSVTLEIQSSTPRKLQTMPLMAVNQTDGKSQPYFHPMAGFNSTTLPAVFVLRLEKPLPVSLTVLRRIRENTGLELVDSSDIQPMTSLLLQQQLKGKCRRYSSSKGLTVRLPDQQHCYFIGMTNGQLQGVLMREIPFSHPTSVPLILKLLREQVLFNTIMASCVRQTGSGSDSESCITFEVTPVSLQSITITFEHPSKDTMTTAELDLSDVTAVKCRLSGGHGDVPICPEEHATRVLQRSLSLPVTMRAVLIKAKDILRAELKKNTHPTVISPVLHLHNISRVGLERRTAFIASRDPVNTISDVVHNSAIAKPHNPSPIGDFEELESRYIEAGGAMNPPNAIYPRKPSPRPANPPVSNDKVARNPMLASLLDQEPANNPEGEGAASGGSQGPGHAPMLSALLGNDLGSTPTATSSPSSTPTALNAIMCTPAKPRRTRKRRSTSDRSPVNAKRKASEDDLREVSSLDLDPGSVSPYDFAGSSVTNAHGSANTTPTLTTPTVNLAGDSNPFLPESHVNRLASTLDSIIKQESKKPSSSSCHGAGDIISSVDMDDAKRDRLTMSSLTELVRSEESRKDWPSSVGGGVGGSSVNGSGASHRRPSLVNANQVSGAVDNVQNSQIVNDSLNMEVFTSGPVTSGNKGSMELMASSGGGVVSKTLGNNKLARLKSQSHDPFSFTASLVRQTSGEPSAGVDDLDLGHVNRKTVSTPLSGKLSLTVSTPTNSVNSNNPVIAKPKANSIQVKSEPGIRLKMEEGSVKVISSSPVTVNRERKKEKREGKPDETGRGSPIVGDKPPITVKLNKNRIIKQSPVHKSPSISPDLGEQWHDKVSKDSSIRTPNSTGHTNSIDLTMEVSEQSKNSQSSGSSGGGGSGVRTPSSPRILTASLKRTDVKSEYKVKGEKRKRSSKHGLVGVDDKKRRRADEAVKKEQLKKQRIYDFDAEVNETENFKVEKGPSVKPNTIKITKISSGSRPLIPGVNKSPSRNSSAGAVAHGGPSVKLLKHSASDKEKSVSSPKVGRPPGQKNHSRSRSEPQGSSSMGSNKLRGVSIKLKPLNLAPGGTTVMVSTPTSTASKSGPSPTTSLASRAPPLPSASPSSNAQTTQRIQSSSSCNSSSNANKASNIPPKSRKGSLSAVIDKLTKQQGTSSFADGKEGSKKSGKDLYEAIRLQLIREGNKPSTPTNESGANSPYKASPGKKSPPATSIASLKAIPKVPKPSHSANNASSAATASGKQSLSHSGSLPGRKSPSVSVGNNTLSNKSSSLAVTSSGVSLPKTSVSMNSGLGSKAAHMSPVKPQPSPLAVKTTTSTNSLATETRAPAERPKELGCLSRSSSTSNIQSPPRAESSSPSVPVRTIPLTKQSLHSVPKTTVSSNNDLCKPGQMVKLVSSSSPHTVPSSQVRTSYTVAAAAVAKPAQPVTFTESPASPTPENRGPNAQPQPQQPKDTTISAHPNKVKASAQEEVLTPERTPSRHFLDAVIKLNGGSEGDTSSGPQNATTTKTGCDSPADSNHSNGVNKPSQAPTPGLNAELTPNTPKPQGYNNSSTHSSQSSGQVGATVSCEHSDSPVASAAAVSAHMTPTASLSPDISSDNRCCTPTWNSQPLVSKPSEMKRPCDVVGSEAVDDRGRSSESAERNMGKPKAFQGSISNLSGSSEDKENKGSGCVGDDDVFKAPTPKPHFYNDFESSEGHRSRSDNRLTLPGDKSRMKNVLSPRSDISSPEDGLVIDELMSPGTPISDLKSPAARGHDRSQSPKSPAGRYHMKQQSPCDVKSPTNHVAHSPSPRKQSRPPSCPSPLAKAKHNLDSPAMRHANSPVDIDDDLMEAALGIV